MELRVAVEVAGIALLAACNVGLWTLRVAVAAAGRRGSAAVLAGVEATLFVAVFSTVASSLSDPARLLAFAAGVASGTLLGMLAEERLSTGQSLVRVVTDDASDEVVALLRDRGWPVTMTAGAGVYGPVRVLHVAVDDRALRGLEHDLDELVGTSFRTVERLRSVRPSPMPAGMHQVARRRNRQADVVGSST